MATLDTGWVSVNTGNSTELIVPFGAVISAQVRWQGVSTTQSSYNEATRSGSGSGTASSANIVTPSVPSGYVFDRHQVSGSVSSTTCGDWVVSLWNLEFFRSGTCTGGSTSGTIWDNSAGYERVYGAGHTGSYTYYFSVRTYGTKTLYTAFPKVTISGVAVTGPSSLSNGQTSSWYTIPPHAFKQGVNTIVHTISGSGKAKVQLFVVHQSAGHVAASTVNIF